MSKKYWVWYNLCFESATATADKLLAAFGNDPENIFKASEAEIALHCSAKTKYFKAICAKDISRAEKIIEYCEENGVGILTQADPEFPAALLNIDGVPAVLYYKGVIPRLTGKLSIGIVGSRRPSQSGLSAAYTVSHDCASAGAVIVSGLASGIDSASHSGAIDAGGLTVAVLGCGIDVVFPKGNDDLMRAVMKNGAVITEYAPSSAPEGWHFTARNRIISGLSTAVAVIEAAEKSGSLITADYAMSQGKDLYAMPGPVGDLEHAGSNALLTKGAHALVGTETLLRKYVKDYPLDLKKIEESRQKHRKTLLNEPVSPSPDPVVLDTGSGEDIILKEASFVKDRGYGYDIGMSVGSLSGSDEIKIPAPKKSARTASIADAVIPPPFKGGAKASKTEKTEKAPKTVKAVKAEKPAKAEVSEPVPKLEGNEKTVYDLLKANGHMTTDSLMTKSGLNYSALITAITILEIKQLITQSGGYYYLSQSK